MAKNKPAEAYPLTWPVGKPRCKRPRRASFGDHSRAYAVSVLQDELRLLGAKNVILSSNLKLRNDGLPYMNQRRPDDEGIAVYFDLNGSPKCFAVDQWDRTEHNVWAIAKSINALRGLERWGSKDMVDAAFRGFEALPAPGMISLDFSGLSKIELRSQMMEAKESNNTNKLNALKLEWDKRKGAADGKK